MPRLSSTLPDSPTEPLAGSVERVPFHNEKTGFCVLRVKVRSHRQALRAKRMRVLLCALPGRAAKRLSKATELETNTIHRLLEFDPKGTGFLHNAPNPLDADSVVIDEGSMVDDALARLEAFDA